MTNPTQLQKNARRNRALKQLALPCFTAGLLVVAGCQLAMKADQSATTRGVAAPVAGAPTTNKETPNLFVAENTGAVVDAANAFLATLSDAQRKTAIVEYTPQNAARWSNFPSAVVRRNGIFLRDMNEKQVAAALEVAKLALSDEGFQRFMAVRAADDAFGASAEAQRGPGGGPGNRGGFGTFGGDDDAGAPNGPRPGGFGGPDGGSLFGNANYMIAFLGTPSKTAPWLLQFGGHHLAFNLTYKGDVGASTPYFVGVQPNIWKDVQGVTHEPLAPMHNAMRDLVNSLSPAQLKQAKLAARFSDVYVGPGRDARFPAQSDGIPVAELSNASKELVKKAIAYWTGDAVQGAQYLKLYETELDRTKVAYSGDPSLSAEGDYVRIDGPHVWIEFACQASNHYHTIWRDKATDYGAEFTFETR